MSPVTVRSPAIVVVGAVKVVPSKVRFALSVTASPVPLVKNSRLAVNDPGVSVSERKSVTPAKPRELVATQVGTPPDTCSTWPVVPIDRAARVLAPEA